MGCVMCVQVLERLRVAVEFFHNSHPGSVELARVNEYFEVCSLHYMYMYIHVVVPDTVCC